MTARPTAPAHPGEAPARPGGRAARALRERVTRELVLGRPVLVADDADRENEVDVVLAAETATERWMAWTIRHSSGYLCAPLPAQRADDLGLPLMVPASQDPRRTAYAVSVDVRHGITTGISAADRTATARALADPATTPEDLVRPGHLLPLRAVPGGLGRRRGHTEAGVELCRLARLAPVAVIAELVQDHGPMMRRAEAQALADREGLVLLTIDELVDALPVAAAEEEAR